MSPCVSRKMSAVCFLYARQLVTLLTREGVAAPPLGLVDADWGGTPVESWSPDSALDKCNSRFVEPKVALVFTSAANRLIGEVLQSLGAFSWLKAPTSAFT